MKKKSLDAKLLGGSYDIFTKSYCSGDMSQNAASHMYATMDLDRFVSNHTEYANLFKMESEIELHNVISDVKSKYSNVTDAIFQSKLNKLKVNELTGYIYFPPKEIKVDGKVKFIDGLYALKASYYKLLNKSDGEVLDFDARRDALALLISSFKSEEEQMAAWRIIYAMAIRDTGKQWLMTNLISEDVDLMIVGMVKKIAFAAKFNTESNITEIVNPQVSRQLHLPK